MNMSFAPRFLTSVTLALMPFALSSCLGSADGVGDMSAPQSATVSSRAPTTPNPATMRQLRTDLCPDAEFWFAGACRGNAWVQATFSDATHRSVVGAIGNRVRGTNDPMLLVESSGQVNNRYGKTVDLTVLRPLGVAGAGGVIRVSLPARGGYQIERVERRTAALPAAYTTYQARATLLPRTSPTGGVRLVTTDWSSHTMNWSRLTNTICNPYGCGTAIASSSGNSNDSICSATTNDNRARFESVCGIAVPVAGAVGGCAGGFIAAAIPSLGVAAGPGCFIGGGALLTAGLAYGAYGCGQLARVMYPEAETLACVRTLEGQGDALNETTMSDALDALQDATPTEQGPNSTQDGLPCWGKVTNPIHYQDADGGDCHADLVYSCNGYYTGGQCQVTGCTVEGRENIVCIYG